MATVHEATKAQRHKGTKNRYEFYSVILKRRTHCEKNSRLILMSLRLINVPLIKKGIKRIIV